MEEFETIKEYEHEGWHIAISLAPDYDYRPGEDDDIYPRFEEVGYYGDQTEERDYDGRFLPQPIIVDGQREQWKVTPEEIARLIEVSGGNPRKRREQIADDAWAIASENLSWAVVCVTASLNGAEGSDYLGGVEYDLRQSPPEKFALESVEDYGMIETAIEQAARSRVGNLATLALSY